MRLSAMPRPLRMPIKRSDGFLMPRSRPARSARGPRWPRALEDVGADVVLGYELFQVHDEAAAIARLAALADDLQVLLHLGAGDDGAGEDLDFFVIGVEGAFVGGAELLEELFPGADAGEMD